MAVKAYIFDIYTHPRAKLAAAAPDFIFDSYRELLGQLIEESEHPERDAVAAADFRVVDRKEAVRDVGETLRGF